MEPDNELPQEHRPVKKLRFEGVDDLKGETVAAETEPSSEANQIDYTSGNSVRTPPRPSHQFWLKHPIFGVFIGVVIVAVITGFCVAVVLYMRFFLDDSFPLWSIGRRPAPTVMNATKTTIAPGVKETKELEFLVPPLTANLYPRDQAALTGQSVTFTCETTGTADIDVMYRWYLGDSNVLKTTIQQATLPDNLYLPTVGIGDNGVYRCTVVDSSNNLIAEAEPATLIVRDYASDFCPDMPNLKSITLPTGCVTRDLNSQLNVGFCTPTRCATTSPNTANHFCGPINFRVFNITCSGQPIALNLISQCGCIASNEPSIDITGYMLDYRDDHVFLSSALVTTGANRVELTSNAGTFATSIPQTKQRITVNITKQFKADRFLDENIFVYHVPKVPAGGYYLSVTQRFATRNNQLYDMNTSNTSEVIGYDFNLTMYSNPVVLYGQTRNIYPMTSMHLYMGLITNHNTSELRAIPGDFTAIDNNGNTFFIAAYGFYHFEFRDDLDNWLVVASNMTLSLSSQKNLTDLPVWYLDPSSGYWFASPAKLALVDSPTTDFGASISLSRYRVNLTGITSRTAWVAVAEPVVQLCASKIRIFSMLADESGGRTKDELFRNAELYGAEVAVTSFAPKGQSTMSRVRVRSDNADLNGYCVVHPCSSDTIIEVTAYYNGYQLQPLKSQLMDHLSLLKQTNVSIKASTVLDPSADTSTATGPFYAINFKTSPVYGESVCSLATKTDNFFAFWYNMLAAKEILAVENQARNFDDLTECTPPFFVLWNSVQEYSEDSFAFCYVKVVAVNGEDALVRAISRVKTNVSEQYNPEVQPGAVFGIHEAQIHNGQACLPVRPSGYTTCKQSQSGRLNVHTEVEIQLLDRNAFNVTINSAFKDVDSRGNAEDARVVLDIGEAERYVGTTDGVYCSYNRVLTEAKRRAKNKCSSGTTSEEARTKNSVHYIVQFEM